MPEAHDQDKNKFERKKAHNDVEKKRKDKLKIAIDDLRKSLPISVTENKKLSHHEVLLKTIDYMKELEFENKKLLSETSDITKGKIIENWKMKFEGSLKEIERLKLIIEKQCMPSISSTAVVQNWKSKGKVSGTCQASPKPNIDFVQQSSEDLLTAILNNNRKQKKGLTIAQSLVCRSDIPLMPKEKVIEMDQSASKSLLLGNKQAHSPDSSAVNNVSRSAESATTTNMEIIVDGQPSCKKANLNIDQQEQNTVLIYCTDIVTAPVNTNKVSDRIVYCSNPKTVFFTSVNSDASLSISNFQMGALSSCPSITGFSDTSSGILSNSSITLLYTSVSPPTLSLSLVSPSCVGLPYQLASARDIKDACKNMENDKIPCNSQEEMNLEDESSACNENTKKNKKKIVKSNQRLRMFHCCNWYLQNLSKQRKRKFNLKRLKSLAHRKGHLSPSTSCTVQFNKELDLFSSQTTFEEIPNKSSNLSNNDGNNPNDKEKELFISTTISSNTPKINKPIWVVAKSLANQVVDKTSVTSNYLDCFHEDASSKKGDDSSNSSSEVANIETSESRLKHQSDMLMPRGFDNSTINSCHNNSNPRSDYHDITNLLLNPISTFPDLYDRTAQNKTLEHSFIEDASIYGSGVSYLNENDLQFEIEDDMFSSINDSRINQPPVSPFNNQIHNDKSKQKGSRKDCQLNFSFSAEDYHQNLNHRDSYSLHNGFGSVDKNQFSSSSNAIYRPMSFHSPHSTIITTNSINSTSSLDALTCSVNGKITTLFGDKVVAKTSWQKNACTLDTMPSGSQSYKNKMPDFITSSECMKNAFTLDTMSSGSQSYKSYMTGFNSSSEIPTTKTDMNSIKTMTHQVPSNLNCRFDNLMKNQYDDYNFGVYSSVSALPNKDVRNFDLSSFTLKHANENTLSDSLVSSNNTSIFSLYSEYGSSSDKSWLHSTQTPLFSSKTTGTHQQMTVSSADFFKKLDNGPECHQSSLNKTRQMWPKLPDSSDFYESSLAKNQETGDISSMSNSTNHSKTNCFSMQSNTFSSKVDDFSSIKVSFASSQQPLTATKLWNPDQYPMKSKPFSFYPLSYEDGSARGSMEEKNNCNNGYVAQRIEEHKNMHSSETGFLKSDHFANTSDVFFQDECPKTTSHILTFIPSHSLKNSFAASKSYHYGMSSNICGPQFSTPSFANNCYSLPVQSADLHNKTNDASYYWSMASISKPSNASNFAPLFNFPMNPETQESSVSFQTSSQSKSTFSNDNYYKSYEMDYESDQLKTSTKRNSTNSNKTFKKLQKLAPNQDLSTKCPKSNYCGNYPAQNSYHPSDFMVGPFDRPTYLNGDNQLMPTYSSVEPSSELNLNSIFGPPLPSHQPNDIKLNLYQNTPQSHCSPAFHAPDNSALPLSSNRLPSALPSIHHFGFNNIFNEFSRPLSFGANVNSFSTVKLSQPESFAPPNNYRYNMTADALAPAANSLSTTEVHFSSHVPTFFNNSHKINSLNKNSMSINNLLGNQKPF